MSEKAHTPGPWTKGVTISYYTAIDGPRVDDEPVAWADFKNPADLALALAAPDMLAALKDLTEVDAEDLLDSTSEAWQAAYAAIAKAEGKS